MAGLRSKGYAGDVERQIMPGDVLLGGEVLSALATVGSGILTAAMIATGLIRRTGPAGGFTDTTDTAANIIAALSGNNPAADVVPGNTFRLRYINTVAQAMTFAAGVGVVTGVGTVNVAASVIRDYLITILNASPPVQLSATFLTASAAIVFTLPPGMSAFPIGPNPQSVNITPGMGVVDVTTAGSFSAGTTVVGVTQGQGGIIGVTLNQNTTAPSAAAPGDVLSFFPRVQFDSLGSLAA